jgi:hypothetical protein
MAKQTVIFGDFVDPPVREGKRRAFYFSPTSDSLEKRWPIGGRTADYASDFVGENLPDMPSEKRLDIEDSVGYVSNELLENALKYAFETAENEITFFIYLLPEAVYLYSRTALNSAEVGSFQCHLERLQSSDLEALFQDQLEQNLTEDIQQSSLGFLTLLLDYGVDLAWKFETVESIIWLTTMARMEIL